ncbi:MAG: hypothetical protein ACLPV8_13790, partial [Steroidobacteraceae bacterium]
RERYSGTPAKPFTMRLESCSRRVGIDVHDALETLTTMSRNMQASSSYGLTHQWGAWFRSIRTRLVFAGCNGNTIRPTAMSFSMTFVAPID